MEKETSLTGKLLVAMPNMGDPRFHKSVIFICTHDENGAMGIVINQYFPNMVLGDLLNEIDADVKASEQAGLPVLLGGPVDTTRGFLLHTGDYKEPGTIEAGAKFGVSGTIDALRSYAEQGRPKDMLFALGYAGWGEDQLERELLDNTWLVVDADYELVFNTKIDDRWSRALTRHGIDPDRLSVSAGHA